MNSDISAYTYERTLIMEQRNQMLRELQLNKKQSLGVVSIGMRVIEMGKKTTYFIIRFRDIITINNEMWWW